MIHLKNLVLLMLFVPCLAACQQIGEGGRMAKRDTVKALDDTGEALKRVFYYYPEVEQYKPIPYAFCYRVMQDINCYDRPMPEARMRLVGWQGRDGSFIKKGEKLPSPQESVKQDPAVHVRERASYSNNQNAKQNATLKPLDPVNVSAPPAVKEDKVKVNISNSVSDSLY